MTSGKVPLGSLLIFSSSVNPNADLIFTFFAFGVTSFAVFGLEASLLVARRLLLLGKRSLVLVLLLAGSN